MSKYLMSYIKPALICLACAVLLACQHFLVASDVNLQPYIKTVSADSTLVLQQTLVIPPNQARVYLQHGARINASDIDRYQPWCEFEINTLSKLPQNINADTFHITRLVNERSALLEGEFGYKPFERNLEEYATVMYLQSAAQPDVLRITCLQRADAMLQKYLTLQDIHQTLGNVFFTNIK